ncbi:MAG: hypothetical protein ACI83N_002357 [Hydrogenophaga sp.]|jgi:hypothetical protein
MKTGIAFITAVTSLPALAHEGHGLFGSHWHATDVLGFVAAAAAVALAIWLSKK